MVSVQSKLARVYQMRARRYFFFLAFRGRWWAEHRAESSSPTVVSTCRVQPGCVHSDVVATGVGSADPPKANAPVGAADASGEVCRKPEDRKPSLAAAPKEKSPDAGATAVPNEKLAAAGGAAAGALTSPKEKPPAAAGAAAGKAAAVDVSVAG